MLELFSNDVGFARVLLWIRFPHLNTPACFSHLDLKTVEERLNFVICLCLEHPEYNGGVL